MVGFDSRRLGGAFASVLVAAIIPASIAAPFQYSGLCEASGAAALDATHFAVASDETNTIRIYKRGVPDPVGKVDFEDFIRADKSDLEGAAAVEGRLYWISSHSFNKAGEDKPKRKRFIATDITAGSAGPTLAGAGVSRGDLRDALAIAADVEKSGINIEGLAAAENGALLLGFRSPQKNGNAIVVELSNPSEVVNSDETAAKFGSVWTLQLGGLGIRSIELVHGSPQTYLIAAGSTSDSQEFALYRWSPGSTVPLRKLDSSALAGMRPEALFVIPGTNVVQVLSDDGSDQCSDESTPDGDRHFRSVDIEID
ncbi:DUF3616 domain-containing protein [Mesorhizobium muleiense]|uniref:DUF3616 domain-containing protein n=1 Tax=Mesorhizobium muleiense TaxID=1004279 RepID=UPI001F3F466C|nr:DUF3616 domain-containing protein [Mesorhizobium muleiense]MCF6112227.1 DUF3616 domain-containing protein [Mesorhizobium muleiense]